MKYVQHNTDEYPTVVLDGDTVHIFGWVRVVERSQLDREEDGDLLGVIRRGEVLEERRLTREG